jgi:hypothetical protein
MAVSGTRRWADPRVWSWEWRCCYALQDKVWAYDPDGVAWEYYTVLEHIETP